MERVGVFCVLALAASGLTGCALCASPFDYDYPAYGGRIERIDRTHGRVGSVWSSQLPVGPDGEGPVPEVEWLPDGTAGDGADAEDGGGNEPADNAPADSSTEELDWNFDDSTGGVELDEGGFESPHPATRGTAPQLEDDLSPEEPAMTPDFEVLQF